MGGALSKERGHPHVAKGTLDEKTEPGGELETCEDKMYPVVVNGVEGLSSVEEKEQAVYLLLDTLIEEGVDVGGVVDTRTTLEETLLRGVDEGQNGGHDSTSDRRSENAVIGVGNTQRASGGLSASWGEGKAGQH